MPKTKISEFSATPGNNTDIDGINIAEGCAPSGINDAIRELMAQLKDFQAGTAGDSFNGPVGTSTAAAGAFTTLSATGVATFSSGTAGAPAITTTGDTNTGIFFPAADTVAASVGGTEGLRLTSTGLGVGTSTPGSKLDVTTSSVIAGTFTGASTAIPGTAGFWNNTVAGLDLYDSAGGSGYGVGVRFRPKNSSSTVAGIAALAPSSTSSALVFHTQDSNSSVPERMRLDSSGNLGLGVTPSAWGSGSIAFQIGNGAIWKSGSRSVDWITNGYYNGTNYIYSTSNAATYYRQFDGVHSWYNAPSGTAGNAISFTQAMTLDSSGRLGVGTTSPATAYRMSLTGDGSAMVGGLALTSGGNTAYIGQVGATSADCEYWNAANGYVRIGTNNTERARITSGGYFKASNNGTYAGSTSGYHEFYQTNNTDTVRLTSTSSAVSGAYGLYVDLTADPNATDSFFVRCYGGANQRASIRSNGGLANYSANDVNLSDRREKTNFAPAKDYLDTICAIPVQTFNYIDQSEDDPGTTLGVVAQDVQAVAPELVMESNWGTKDDPKMRLSIYQTDLQYALMKCIQELKAELDSVKAELNALKGT